MKNKLLALLALFTIIGVGKSFGATYLFKVINNCDVDATIQLKKGNTIEESQQIPGNSTVKLLYGKFWIPSQDKELLIYTGDKAHDKTKYNDGGTYKIWDAGDNKMYEVLNYVVQFQDDTKVSEKTSITQRAGVCTITITIESNGKVKITDWTGLIQNCAEPK